MWSARCRLPQQRLRRITCHNPLALIFWRLDYRARFSIAILLVKYWSKHRSFPEEILMQHCVTAVVDLVTPTITGTEATQLILRWFHFIAGITWVGLLYFFNLINVPFMKQVDAAAKPKIFQNLTLPALNWFRWSSLVTVFVGFWYWGQFYVG